MVSSALPIKRFLVLAGAGHPGKRRRLAEIRMWIDERAFPGPQRSPARSRPADPFLPGSKFGPENVGKAPFMLTDVLFF